MRNKILIAVQILIIISLAISNSSRCFSQNSDLSLNITTANIQQLSPSQFDFQNFQSSVWLFTIEIIYPGTHGVRLENGQITVNLNNGTIIQLFEGTGFYSDQFDVINNKSITNFDLGKSGIKIHNLRISSEGRKGIIEPALASGMFPSGTYTFTIKAVDVDTAQVSDQEEVSFIFESFTQVELRFPRDGEFTNEFPLFEWFFDGQETEVTINEKPPGTTFEEAISRFPVHYKNNFIGGQNSFQYPSSGERPLEKGKTYVWRVVGKTQNVTGRAIQSPIGYFKVTDDATPLKHSELLDQIEAIIGPKWKNVMNKIRSDGLEPTEKFQLNEQQLSDSELQEILDFLRSNTDNINKVTLE